MKILFEDNDIIVLVKPVGVPSEDTKNGEKGILNLLKTENNLTDVFLLHRLDRNVGGVMVFAKNKKSAACISKQIQENTFKKTYLAVTDGVIEEKQGIYKDLLFKDSSKNRSFVVNRMRKGVKEASLEYEVLSEIENKTLVKVTLHTGRTHQIRVQFSSRKTPLCGDVKYGSKDKQSDIALFSHSITFTHPVTNEFFTFTGYPNKINYPWELFESVI
ncbi:MAG: RluA family pseudouridine synthase [Clostridia bacterium]|nr:RluA family pseudouridine synthase [Clostridia bacterium]